MALLCYAGHAAGPRQVKHDKDQLDSALKLAERRCLHGGWGTETCAGDIFYAGPYNGVIGSTSSRVFEVKVDQTCLVIVA